MIAYAELGRCDLIDTFWALLKVHLVAARNSAIALPLSIATTFPRSGHPSSAFCMTQDVVLRLIWYT